jgi:glycosyltransferase involved in cell wall biosynthesis
LGKEIKIEGKKMKIVLISSGVLPVPCPGYGGLEMVVADLAISLDKLGHEVYVICPTESKIAEYGKIQHIDGGPINPNAHEWEAKAYEKYAPMLLSEMFKGAIIHDHSWRKFPYLLKMDHKELNLTATLHGMLCYHKPPPMEKPSLIGLSKRHADMMSGGLGVPVRFCYNGIDLEKYSFNGGKRNNNYLFLARITAFKGAHVFADTIKQMNARGDIVGDDQMVEDKDYVKRILEVCNNYPNLRYWGGVSRERAVEFFKKSKCYVLPCTPGWEEPFGLTVIEAMACGCPVVATASGAIPELIENGKSGYVLLYSQDLTKALSNDMLSQIKAEDCRKQAEKFSREAMAENYLKLYAEVLENGGW